MIVKGAWWAAAAQPIMLSIGAVFAALNMDIIEQPMPFINFRRCKSKNKKGLPKYVSDIPIEETFDFIAPKSQKEIEA